MMHYSCGPAHGSHTHTVAGRRLLIAELPAPPPLLYLSLSLSARAVSCPAVTYSRSCIFSVCCRSAQLVSSPEVCVSQTTSRDDIMTIRVSDKSLGASGQECMSNNHRSDRVNGFGCCFMSTAGPEFESI